MDRKFLIDIRKDRLIDNEYQLAKIDRLLKLEDFGMNDTYFGGNVRYVAKLKDKKYYLLVNAYHQTIGICVRLDELDNLSKKELLDWAKVQNIRIGNEDSREDIINKLIA
jgi:hypothetical protein